MNNKCRAQDPKTCYKHGSGIQKALKNNDINAFLDAKEAEAKVIVPKKVKVIPEPDIYDVAAAKLAKEAADALVMPISIDSLTATEKEKIVNNAERYGLSYNEVLKSVLTNKVAYLNVVGKTTSRQGLPEKVFKEYVEKENIVSSIAKLPAGGKDALYLIDGVIRSKTDGLTDKDISNAGVKSLDFKIVTKKGKIGYIAAKHTKLDGGGQDNQYNDILTTLKHYDPTNKDFLLILNVDGEYYSKYRNKHGKSYIDFMKETYNHPNVFITTYKTFKTDLGKL